MSELIKYVNGDVRPARADRTIARQGRKVYDEVRLAALQSDGQMALAGHMMQKVAELDNLRTSVAGSDPVVNQLLIEIEAQAIQKSKAIHGGLFSQWQL